MAKTIIDYNSTVVTPIANGVNIPIPTTPAGIAIATTSVFIDPANPAFATNKVELTATIGYRTSLGEPEIIARLWRAGTEINYALAGDAFDEVDEYSLVSLQMIEHAPLGTQNYQLIVENRDRRLIVKGDIEKHLRLNEQLEMLFIMRYFDENAY